MKKIKLIICILLFAATVNAQSVFGYTESELRNLFPEKTFTVGYSDIGSRYISTDMAFGRFTYYFNKETKLSYFGIQYPFNPAAMNAQVEIYNKKYVITSETSWTAYLEGGGNIYINLFFSNKNKIRYFAYSETK